MIDLKSVTKIFYQKGKEIVALSDVSLRVPTGKIVGVIGTSGAGKSTLIRCVNLLEKPTSGDVLIEGRSLLRLTPIQLAKERRQIGMIFQHFNLLSSRTVYENVAFPLELDHTPTAKIRQRVLELLKLVGLEDRVNDYPATLSGGQKQRVAIARTLASRPKVLLCDEATSALDPSTTRSILNLLKDINRQFQITILLITHEMEVVKYICDEVAVIDQGKLVEKGTVAEIFTHPKTERTKAFVNSSLHIDIPETYLQRLQTSIGDRKNQLLRLTLTGQTINEPILSEAVRLFNVDTQIISAHMDHGGDVSFGVLLIELAGNQPQHQKVIQFFTDKHIQVDFLGYV